KAEQKVTGLHKALTDRQSMWERYEKDLKASYRKEHAKFQRDMLKLKEDLTKATDVQETARKAESTAKNDAQEVIRRALEANRRQAPQELMHHETGAAMSDVARGPPEGGHPIGPPGLVAPTAAPGEGSTDAAAPPPEWMMSGFAAFTDGGGGTPHLDPYMSSPGNLRVSTNTSPTQHYKSADGVRLSVKTRSALAPFGVLPPGHPGNEGRATEIKARLGGFSLLDDDKDLGGQDT
ncbi:unnamed protein product, partial [Symbiodinium sp. CCMP2456]